MNSLNEKKQVQTCEENTWVCKCRWFAKSKVNILVSSLNFSYENNVSSQDASEIAQLIIEENLANGKHMLEKSPKEIVEQTQEYWCSIARSDNKLVWFMTVMTLPEDKMNLFEIWSLIVKEDFRWLWIWKKVIDILIKNNSDKNLYAISNNPVAISALKHWGWLILIEKTSCPKEFINTIESAWELLEDDVILVNEKLLKILYK